MPDAGRDVNPRIVTGIEIIEETHYYRAATAVGIVFPVLAVLGVILVCRDDLVVEILITAANQRST